MILVLAAGCTSMSESECRSTDWAQIGERDGLANNRPRIDQYAHQCGQHNMRVVEKDYMDGWWTGNAEFVRRADSMEGAQ